MQSILNKLSGVTERGADKKGRRNWKAKCPAHDDRDPSLLITEDPTRALFYCRSGCSQPEIMSALEGLGLKGKDLNWDTGYKPRAKPAFDDYHRFFIAIYQADRAKGNRPSKSDQKIYKDCLARRAMQ